MASRKVIKEFLGRIMQAVAKRKGATAAKRLLNDPEMKKLAARAAKVSSDIEKRLEKDGSAGAKDALDFLRKLEY
jgi:hypothetical protein